MTLWHGVAGMSCFAVPGTLFKVHFRCFMRRFTANTSK